MTAEECEVLSVDEAEGLLAERYSRLSAAGYSPTSALLTASRFEIDLELALQLVCEKSVGSACSVCAVF